MRTIYVILAEKQYSSSKVIAAFDTQEGADKMKAIIEGVEPRFTLSVQPIELHTSVAPGGVLPRTFQTFNVGDCGPELVRPPAAIGVGS